MPRDVRVLAAVVIAFALGPGEAQAQADASAIRGGPAERRLAAADSESVFREVRSAQATFERARRHYLPRRHGAPSGPCGEVIGRFCYWDDDSTDDVPVHEIPPAEHPRTIEARARLLATLDSAGTRVPGDGWIAGLHVHYLLEAAQVDQATARARVCGAESWWCAALEGLAHHAGWRYAEADSAFNRALATMPDSVRCDWTSLDVLLDARTRETYRQTDCDGRDALNAWIWWLADPSYLRHGNDRRTEHFARVTRARIHRRSASGYGTAWRDDLDQIARRFGWPSHFTQELPPAHRMEGPRISAYHDSPSYHFVANENLAPDLRAYPDTSWALRPVQPRERYSPPYATFWNLEHQATLFRRGDSVLLVVAYDASGDSLLRVTPVTAALVASAGPPPLPDQRTVRHDAPTRGTLRLTLPDTAVIASAELLGGARMLRARFGAGFPSAPRRALRMSELAFFDPTDSLPADLDAFLPLARASATVASGSSLGLFWELYGSPPRGDGLALNVEIVREGVSWLRRAGERVGLINRSARVAFGWRESPRGDGIDARALVVDLRGLDPGTYRIEVSLTPDGETPLVASRRIEVTR